MQYDKSDATHLILSDYNINIGRNRIVKEFWE